jgi:hypothetical protein
VYRIAFTGFAQLYHHKYKFAIPHPSFYFHSEKWHENAPEAVAASGVLWPLLFRVLQGQCLFISPSGDGEGDVTE